MNGDEKGRYEPVLAQSPPPDDADDVRFVRCRTCGYEKVLGQPCGEPCV